MYLLALICHTVGRLLYEGNLLLVNLVSMVLIIILGLTLGLLYAIALAVILLAITFPPFYWWSCDYLENRNK